VEISRSGVLLSLNLAAETIPTPYDTGRTGIAKQPVTGPVAVFDPGPKRVGHPHPNGLAGDNVCTTEHHGGTDQAVYAYAREDLDWWERELGYDLPSGRFGENLTTEGLDCNGALIGERWRIGPAVVLEASGPRIPCGTFQGWLAEAGWIKRFALAGRPGAYFRVIEPGEIQAGDEIEIVHRPDHEITVALTFRALLVEPDLLPRLLTADALNRELKEMARRRVT
jgi:MOSC domain-containing protein YiiM